MENLKMENLKLGASRYVLTSNLLNEILNNLIEVLKQNNNNFIGANREDMKLNKRKIRINELVNIINLYRTKDCNLADDERKMVIYKGDPYLTLNLCLQSLTQRNKILLVHDKFMVEVNNLLVQIINNVLKQYNIENLIEITDIDYDVKSVNKLSKYFDKIVVIGDSTMYQCISSSKEKVFFNYNNIALYCENDELKKIKDAIYIYANENNYEIEILYNDNIKEVIEEINCDEFKNIAVLLTKNKEIENEFTNNVKEKIIYINQNPFKDEIRNINNYLK